MSPTLLLLLALHASPAFAPEACVEGGAVSDDDCRRAREFVERQKGKDCLVVFKTKRLLYLFRAGTPVSREIDLKDYDPNAPKSVKTTLRFPVPVGLSTTWDHRPEEYGTPEGEYTLCSSWPKSKYTHFFGLSYPGPKDVERALKDKWRKPAQLERIKNSQRPGACPDFYTGLGGDFGIHGGPAQNVQEYAEKESKDPEILQLTRSDWTLGCVAVENRVIRFFAKELKVGTPILILR
jgi:hypothetical protein